MSEGNEKESVNKQESSKNRPDLSVTIYERLTLPIREEPHDPVSSPLPENLGDVDPIAEINVSGVGV